MMTRALRAKKLYNLNKLNTTGNVSQLNLALNNGTNLTTSGRADIEMDTAERKQPYNRP